MNSIVSALMFILIILAFLALAIKVITKKVAAVLVLAWLFFYGIHPGLREGISAIFYPLLKTVAPLLLILLGLGMIIRRKRH